MAYLADFQEDVFISYASIDDEPLLGEQDGWVTQLHRNLTARVKMRLGADTVRLWRDNEIRSHEDFANKIESRLSSTAALLSVLSPSFLKRQWTMRELETFVRHAHRGVGILLKNEKSRIFKVEKMEVPRDELPPVMQGTKSYKFFGENKREFWAQIEKMRYLNALDDLATDIANLLREMAQSTRPAERPAVYVAETTSDLDEQARAVRRELGDRGYAVLPEGDLPRRSDAYIGEVRENLKRAALSIHLIGARYGLIPEGETRSIVRIQHDLAMERSADPNFVRLIWMLPALHPAEESQRVFIDYLHTDADVQKGADILECKLDDLKTAVHDKLAAIQRSRQQEQQQQQQRGTAAVDRVAVEAATNIAASALQPDDAPTIYIICDPHDLSSSQLASLKNRLLDRGFEPVVPSESDLRDAPLRKHLDNLNLCDAFLIFYGAGSPEWLAEKLGDYRQYLRGRNPRVLAKAIYIAAPNREDKRELRTNEAMVLRGGAGASLGDIELFIEQIRAGQPGRS